jgi:hypothetical protein
MENAMNVPAGSSSLTTAGFARKGRGFGDHGIYVGDWNNNPVEIWEDADGDIGIMDSRGYSIVLHRQSSHLLLDWLANHEKRIGKGIRRNRRPAT